MHCDRDRPLARARRSARRSRAYENVGLRLRRRARRSTSARCEPPPTKLVANLPYNIATPLVVETLEHAAVARALVRDGAARGRRPLLRRAADEGLRRRVRPRSARRPQGRLSPRLRRPCSVRDRGSSRPSSPSSASPVGPPLGGRARRRRGRVRPPSQDARELDRARRRSRVARAGRSTRSRAIGHDRAVPAPRSSSRSSSSPLAEALR